MFVLTNRAIYDTIRLYKACTIGTIKGLGYRIMGDTMNDFQKIKQQLRDFLDGFSVEFTYIVKENRIVAYSSGVTVQGIDQPFFLAISGDSDVGTISSMFGRLYPEHSNLELINRFNTNDPWFTACIDRNNHLEFRFSFFISQEEEIVKIARAQIAHLVCMRDNEDFMALVTRVK